MLAEAPSTTERAVETGSRGSGGDRTLVIDSVRRGASCSPSCRSSATRASASPRSPRSAARSTSATRSIRVIIDPIDGSLNAKRGIPSHALSIASPTATTMADVAFGFVYDFGPREEWWARRGEGACSNGERLDPSASASAAPRRPARGARDRVGRPALGGDVDRRRW